MARSSRRHRAAPGFQLSLYGIFGLLAAADEGIELKTCWGLHPRAFDFLTRPAVKLPALGRFGLPR